MSARSPFILKKPDIRGMKERYREKADSMARLVAEEAARRARILVPVDTGRLRASIDTGRLGLARYFIKAQTRYAKWVEFIHKPFLRPAAESARRSLRKYWRSQR